MKPDVIPYANADPQRGLGVGNICPILAIGQFVWCPGIG
jgi:hypothetical protein